MLSKALGRLFGEIVNASEEAAKGFKQGYLSARPKNDYIDPKTKQELKDQWQQLKDNTERIVNKAADKMEARREYNRNDIEYYQIEKPEWMK